MRIIQGLIFGTVMLIIELIMAYQWLTKIYLSDKNMSLGQFMTHSKRLCILLYRTRKKRTLPDEGMMTFLKDNSNVYKTMASYLFLAAAGMAVFSLVSVIVTVAGGGVILQLIFTIIAYLALKDLIRDNEAEVSSVLDEYIGFLMELDMEFGTEVRILLRSGDGEETSKAGKRKIERAHDQEKSQKKELKNEKWYDRKCFWLLMIVISSAVAIIYWFQSVDMVKKFFCGDTDTTKSIMLINRTDIVTCAVFLAIAAVMWMITNRNNPKRFDFVKQKLRRIIGIRKEEIEICPELLPWKDEIIEMCRRMEITGVIFSTCDNGRDIAFSDKGRQEEWVVMIDRFQVESMREYFPDDLFREIMLFILGHELVHIFYGDMNRSHWVLPGLGALCGTFAYFLGVFMVLKTANMINIVTILLWSLTSAAFAIFVEVPLTNSRYWSQVQELRADRKSMELSDLKPQVFVQLSAYCNEREMLNEDDAHPDNELRCRELFLHDTWGVLDYVRYCIRFSQNHFLKRKDSL